MKKLDALRKVNAWIAAFILALFLLHAVSNSFQLLGVGHLPPEPFLSLVKTGIWILPICVGVHLVLGAVLTVLTLRAAKQEGASYSAEVKRFWIIRITGVVIAVMIVFHLLIFVNISPGPLRLHDFGVLQLALMLILVAALAIHLVLNIKPLMVDLGIRHPRGRAIDIILVVSLLLVLMTVAFVVYYLRWTVV